jgi:hypothetical protein
MRSRLFIVFNRRGDARMRTAPPLVHEDEIAIRLLVEIPDESFRPGAARAVGLDIDSPHVAPRDLGIDMTVGKSGD